jgi:hypothetical protein
MMLGLKVVKPLKAGAELTSDEYIMLQLVYLNLVLNQ